MRSAECALWFILAMLSFACAGQPPDQSGAPTLPAGVPGVLTHSGRLLVHPKLKGVHSYGVIMSTIEGKGNRLLACFTQHTQDSRSSLLRVTVRLLLNELGYVVFARVTESKLPARFVRCIRMCILRTRFPPPTGGKVLVEHTITYHPRN